VAQVQYIKKSHGSGIWERGLSVSEGVRVGTAQFRMFQWWYLEGQWSHHHISEPFWQQGAHSSHCDNSFCFVMMIELDILKGKSSDALWKGLCCKDQNVEKGIPRVLLWDGEGEGQNVKENFPFVLTLLVFVHFRWWHESAKDYIALKLSVVGSPVSLVAWWTSC